MDALMWFTKFENTKPLALVLFFAAFCIILYYVFGSKKRGEWLESQKYIPLQDD